MESLAANPIIKNSQVFYNFLSIEKESDFNSKKKEYAKIKAPTKLTEHKTIEGEVNNFYFIFIKKIHIFFRSNQKYQKKWKEYQIV